MGAVFLIEEAIGSRSCGDRGAGHKLFGAS